MRCATFWRLAPLGLSVAAVALVTFVLFRLAEGGQSDDGGADLSPRDPADRDGLGHRRSDDRVARRRACFNFFFLPPVGTLTIADPQNWVALLRVSHDGDRHQPAVRPRAAADDRSARRQRDLERLYALSRALLLSERGASIPATIARHIAEAFDAAERVASTITARTPFRGRARGAAGRSRPSSAKSRGGRRRCTIRREPVRHRDSARRRADRQPGDLGAGSSDTVLQSIANLAAIGLERARGQRSHGARRSGAREQRAARDRARRAGARVQDAADVDEGGRRRPAGRASPADARDRELVVDHRRGTRPASGARDATPCRCCGSTAGDFAVHRERHQLARLVAATLRKFGARLDGHRVVDRRAAGR